MPSIPRRIIEASLLIKGFVKEDGTHHCYFHHEYKGKRTGSYTYTSHGSGFKEYDDNLLNQMKKQLRLKRFGEVRDLLKCPMTKDLYNEKLREDGLID